MTFRPLPLLSIFALIALAILIALGVWQMQRRVEKHELLAQIAARRAAAPAPIEILLATGAYAAFRHATAVGVFDHKRQAYVHAPRSDRGPTELGKKVVAPFRLQTGGTILVDRGWVSDIWPTRDKGLEKEPEGEVEIEGVLRPSTAPRAFTPEPDLAKRVFYARDSAAIATFMGVSLQSPLILEQTSRLGDPEPLPPSELNIPDNHLNYALTWFALALVLAIIYLRFHYVRGRLKFGR
jgi:surfeit locus 1 family protein